MSTEGGPDFTFCWPGGAVRPLAPRQLRHCWWDGYIHAPTTTAIGRRDTKSVEWSKENEDL